MDPITLAAKRFQSEVRHFFEPPPGREPPKVPALRVVVGGSHLKEVSKALRLVEWDPESRHPHVIVEDPCDGPDYGGAVARRLEADYAALRGGLAEDQLPLAALAPLDRPVTPGALASAVRSASTQIARHLGGLVLALVPKRVADPATYAAIVHALAARADLDTTRVLVLSDPSIEPALDAVATFAVDEAALLDHLKNLGAPSGAAGPPDRRVQPTSAQKREVERRTGRAIAGEQSARDLRALLLDAGDLMGKGKYKQAARKFRAARMLCHLVGQPLEEGAASVAVGSAALSGGDGMAALAAFRRGREIAVAVGSKQLELQAVFGVAATHFFARRVSEARAAYVELEALAAELPPMKLEAIRMQAECLLQEGQARAGAARLDDVLTETEALEPAVRFAVPYKHAGERLVDVLRGLREPARAEQTVQRIARITDPRSVVVQP